MSTSPVLAEETSPAISANSQKEWDKLWLNEGRSSWRKEALASVYDRIAELVPRGSRIIDVGGGVGLLAEELEKKAQCRTLVLDHSEIAVAQAKAAGLAAMRFDLLLQDLREVSSFKQEEQTIVVATEVLEHLTE